MGCGLTRGTINRLLNQDKPASVDVIKAISICENASMRWLTDGAGEPFYVFRAVSDGEGAEKLDALMEEAWTINIGWRGDSDQYLLVLTQPAAFMIRDREVRYTIIELITGNLGHQTARRLAQAQEAGADLRDLRLSDQFFTQCGRGEIGVYHLMGWHDTPGELIRARTMKGVPKVDEEPPKYVSSREDELVTQFRRLPKNEQAALLTVSRSMARERYSSVVVDRSGSSVIELNHIHKAKNPDDEKKTMSEPSKADADTGTVDN